MVKSPLVVTGEPVTDRKAGTSRPTLVTVPPLPVAVNVPSEKERPEPTVTSVKPALPSPAKMLVLVPVPAAVAVNVPPVKERPVPTVTSLKPPEPLPYRMLEPDVAGA